LWHDGSTVSGDARNRLNVTLAGYLAFPFGCGIMFDYYVLLFIASACPFKIFLSIFLCRGGVNGLCGPVIDPRASLIFHFRLSICLCAVFCFRFRLRCLILLIKLLNVEPSQLFEISNDANARDILNQQAHRIRDTFTVSTKTRKS